MTGTGKRKFIELQRLILKSLKKRRLSINEISESARINWNSTSRQLVLLKGMDFVREVFSHQRLRVFELTEKGKREMRQ